MTQNNNTFQTITIKIRARNRKTSRSVDTSAVVVWGCTFRFCGKHVHCKLVPWIKLKYTSFRKKERKEPACLIDIKPFWSSEGTRQTLPCSKVVSNYFWTIDEKMALLMKHVIWYGTIRGHCKSTPVHCMKDAYMSCLRSFTRSVLYVLVLGQFVHNWSYKAIELVGSSTSIAP